MSKRIFFICGAPRSGTTAFAHLINCHPEICCGVERYKYLFGRQRNFIADAFTKERFFDFSESDTNMLPSLRAELKVLYEDMEFKWDEVNIVGDEIPVLFKLMQLAEQVFENCIFVYLVRNIENVASSWNVSAHDENDIWPIENDYKMAVKMWNVANRFASVRLKRQPQTIHIYQLRKFLWRRPR